MASRKKDSRTKRTSRKRTSQYSAKSRSTISRHITKHRHEGMPQRQAVAVAMSQARRKGQKTPARRGRKSPKRAAAGRKGAKTANR